MTKNEVIALARKAGAADITSHGWTSWVGTQSTDFLERFAALIEEHLKNQGYRQCAKGQRTTQFCGMLEEAVQAEREACVKVCEELRLSRNTDWEIGTLDCAAAIRSRT